MKKITVVLFCVLLAACGTMQSRPKTYEEADNLATDLFWSENDKIINEIVKRFPGETMAIWGSIDNEFDDGLSANYEVKMAQHGLLVATRTRMKFINKEFDFQFSGLVADNNIMSYGQMMGVSKIVLIEVKYGGYYRDISVMDIVKGSLLYSGHLDKDLILERLLKQYNIANTNPSTNNTQDEITWTVLVSLSQPENDQAQICRAFSSNAIQYFQNYKYFYNYASLEYSQEKQNYDWGTLVQLSSNGIFDVALLTPNGFYEIYFSNEQISENYVEIGDFRPNSDRRKQICKFINDDIDQVFDKMEKALNLHGDRFSQRSKEAIRLAHIQ